MIDPSLADGERWVRGVLSGKACHPAVLAFVIDQELERLSYRLDAVSIRLMTLESVMKVEFCVPLLIQALRARGQEVNSDE